MFRQTLEEGNRRLKLHGHLRNGFYFDDNRCHNRHNGGGRFIEDHLGSIVSSFAYNDSTHHQGGDAQDRKSWLFQANYSFKLLFFRTKLLMIGSIDVDVNHITFN
jgi:hypothetical protein